MFRIVALVVVFWSMMFSGVWLFAKLRRSRLLARACADIASSPEPVALVGRKESLAADVALAQFKLEEEAKNLHAVKVSLN